MIKLLLICTFFCFTTKLELFTSSLKLCHLLEMEIFELNRLEKDVLKIKDNEDLVKSLQQIREYLPKSYFGDEDYHFDDCLDEENLLSRFITNPVNAYNLIKRFLNNWNFFWTTARVQGVLQELDYSATFEIVTQNELRGARDAIYRLGLFYALEPKYLMDGTLSPEWAEISHYWTMVPKNLTALDLLEVGKVAFGQKDYEGTIKWMGQALVNLKQENPEDYKEILFEVLDYMSWSEYTSGENQDAYQHCLEMINIHPENERIRNNLQLFDKSRMKSAKTPSFSMRDYVLKALTDKESLVQVKKTLSDIRLNGSRFYDFESELSRLLCKHGQLWTPSPENLVGTGCYVVKGNNQFGKFVTVNVEKILSDPDVFIFRGMVSEEDILHFKKMARTNLKTATIHNPVTGVLESANYRITQSSWFDINKDPIIKRMAVKLRVATGLTLATSEDLQIANYGIGGFYDAHFDFATRQEASYKNELNKKNGGRIATYLLYMSDVTIGGRTGFNRLGLSVRPMKTDALFWYNLFKDETGDARTRHIACPVVLGTKWVGNFWIRARGEELSRPCDLVYKDGI